MCVWKFDKSEEEILNRKNIRLDGSGPRERIYSDDCNSTILYPVISRIGRIASFKSENEKIVNLSFPACESFCIFVAFIFLIKKRNDNFKSLIGY